MRKAVVDGSDISLKHLVREPAVWSKDKAPLLVLLHGVRSNEHDLFGLAPALDGRLFIVSARAPLVLGPGAYGWYHVEFAPDGPLINAAEAEASRALLIRFLEELPKAYPVDPNRIYLMGFSQGCAMALSVALTAPEKIAGAIGMSGRLLPGVENQVAPEEALRGLPVLVVHGTRDTVLPIEYGREIRDALRRTPVELTYKEFDMAHQVSQDSLLTVRGWLTARLDAPHTVSAVP